MSGPCLLEHFSALEDPRQAWKVGYPLPEILLVVLCGTMAGAENFVEIERWAKRKLAFLRRLLAFRRGVPSHDILNDVMNALPAATFSECFTAWVDGLRETEPDIVAIDGKTSRRARRGAAHPLHLVSAWATRQRLVLGQEAVATKSNEIIAIPLLLERLELTGALVTIDAMGCQTKIAEAIRAKGADYLLALKDNWPTLAEEVRLFFDTAPADAFSTHETTDGDHGRIETRRYRVSHQVDWLATTAAFRASRASRASPPSPPSRPRSSATARPPSLSASISPPPLSIRSCSPAPYEPIGASRTACTGSWTSSSTTTSCGCEPSTDPQTWPPPSTSPST